MAKSDDQCLTSYNTQNKNIYSRGYFLFFSIAEGEGEEEGEGRGWMNVGASMDLLFKSNISADWKKMHLLSERLASVGIMRDH